MRWPWQKRAKKRSYEAARVSWQTWAGADPFDARREVSLDLETLRARCRHALRNRAYARRIIDALTDALVGQGLRPTIDAPQAEAARVYDLWDRWGAAAVAGARIGMTGLQAHLVRAWLADGEVLARLRTRYPEDMPGLPPLQIQPLEADHLPLSYRQTRPEVDSGIEFDAIGRVTAYWLLRQHPGSSRATREMVRVPASEIIHLYTPDRPGQIRGVPILAPVLIALEDLAGGLDSVRLSYRAAASMVATVSGGEQSPDLAPDGIDEERDGPIPVTDSAGRAVERWAPGMVLYAPPGKDIRIHAPQPPQGLSDYARAMLREVAAGVGLSYHILSGDMSDASFAQAKLGLIAQQQRVDALRATVLRPMLLDPMWQAFVDHAIAADLLPDRPYLRQVRWSRPAAPTADRYQDARAALLEIRAGLRSRTSVIEAGGQDPDEVDAEIAADAARADRLGLILDSDPRRTTLSGAGQTMEVA